MRPNEAERVRILQAKIPEDVGKESDRERREQKKTGTKNKDALKCELTVGGCSILGRTESS